MQASHKDNAQCSLEELLQSQNIVLIEFLGIKNIHTKIRSQLKVFVKYCQKNEDFCNNLIDIGIKCPMHQGSSQLMKTVCYIASDVLTSDSDLIADLLILPTQIQRDRNNSSDQQNQIYENIVDQTQETTKPEQQQAKSLQKNQDQLQKYKFLLRMLNYIEKQNHSNIDQSCLNYLVKSMNCLVGKKFQQIFLLFKLKSQILDNFLSLSHYASVNLFLIKLVSEEQMEQQHNQVRNTIIKSIVQRLKECINHESFVYRLDFIDELFQANKYSSSNDTKSQLQVISDIFVSKDVIQYFMEFAVNPTSYQEYYNSLSFFTLVIKRMNVDEEVDPYNYTNQPKEPTMEFNVDSLFTNFAKFVKEFQINALKCLSQQNYKNKLLGNKFYEMLNLMCKNSRFSNCLQEKNQKKMFKNIIVSSRKAKLQLIKSLISQFFFQRNNGINRYNILFIIQKTLKMRIYQNSTEEQKLKTNSNKEETKIQQPKSTSTQMENILLKTNSNETQRQKEQQQIQKLKLKLKQIKENINKESQNPTSQPQQNNDESSKKRKQKFLNLKLNIRKQSQQERQCEAVQACKKAQEQIEINKNIQQQNQLILQNDIKKKQVSLNREQVNQLLSYLHYIVQKSPIFMQIRQDKQNNAKNHNKIQCFSLLSKLILLICNSLDLKGVQVQQYSRQFKKKVQNDFSFFNVKNIQEAYSTRLAINKHPAGKTKLFTQFQFVQQSIQIFSKEQPKETQNNKNTVNSMELSDGDFRSDQQDGPIIKATKCTLFDIKSAGNNPNPIAKDVIASGEAKNEQIKQELVVPIIQKVNQKTNTDKQKIKKQSKCKQTETNKENNHHNSTAINAQKLRYYVKYLALF